MKNKEEIIEELVFNLQVNRRGYGTWIITSRYTDEKGDVVELKKTTHNEDDYTGIFDGEKYNEYVNSEQFKSDCKVGGLDTNKTYNAIVSDSANEDNYEPREERNRRLAETLFEYNEDTIEYEE